MYREAIEDYDKATSLDPKRTGSYINRGTAKGELGRYRKAIDDFDRALRLAPRMSESPRERKAF